MRPRVLGILFASVLFVCSPKVVEVSDLSPHFLAIETIRKEKPVDFEAMSQTYTTHLQAFVRPADSTTDQRIVDAIAAGTAGDKPHVQSQKVSKLLQKTFFARCTKILDRLPRLIGVPFDRELAKLRSYYRCLQPTVVRRSEWVGKERELDDRCLHELSKLETHPDAKDAAVSTQTLQMLLTKVYVLSILYELEGIEKNRGVDEKKCEEKQVEAVLFLETVRGFAAGDSLAGLLSAELGKGYADIDVERGRALVAQAFPQHK